LVAVYATNMRDQIAANIKAVNRYVLRWDRLERGRARGGDLRGARRL